MLRELKTMMIRGAEMWAPVRGKHPDYHIDTIGIGPVADNVLAEARVAHKDNPNYLEVWPLVGIVKVTVRPAGKMELA